MGQGMAMNLLQTGIDLVVYGQLPGTVDSLVSQGARAAGSIGEIAE